MLRITKLSKKFQAPGGNIIALNDLELFVEKGKFFDLLGPSGRGKSTLLRCVAGLEQPEAGQIFLGAELVTSVPDNLSTDPEDREVAMMFQATYRHYISALGAVAEGLRQYNQLSITKTY
jgi:ABC-type Fe3+/spermidine/putrescine transport system ATPase subunit